MMKVERSSLHLAKKVAKKLLQGWYNIKDGITIEKEKHYVQD